MAVSLLLIPVILLSCLTFVSVSSDSGSSISQISIQTSCENSNNRPLICELEEAKLRIASLETMLAETIKGLDTRSIYLKENEKRLEDMAYKMDHLNSLLSHLKGQSLDSNERLTRLEEEVRLLWDALRKSNFKIHSLETEVQDVQDRVEMVTSQVETMTSMVTEQWIQIQHLEQALHIAEMKELEVKKQLSGIRCTFLAFMKDRFSDHIRNLEAIIKSLSPKKDSIMDSILSRALDLLESILSTFKKYHHELQGFIQQEMERNDLTAPLANQEVVFFMASALLAFPIMSAWMLLTSHIS